MSIQPYLVRQTAMKRTALTAILPALRPVAVPGRMRQQAVRVIRKVAQTAGLGIAKPFQFYVRQGPKNFRSFFTQDRQQDHRQCGKTRAASSLARGRTT